MRYKAPPAVAAVIAAATLAFAGSAAAAEDGKPTTGREVPKLSAPDADASAAVQRIEEQGSALGSYWDPKRAELVVVVGPDSDIGEPEAEKLVGGPTRLERLDIAKRTVDGIREQIAARKFSDSAAEVQLREPPRPAQPAGSSCRPTPRPTVTGGAGQGAPGHRAPRQPARPRPVPPPRRHPLASGPAPRSSSGGTCSAGLHRPQAVGHALHDDGGPLLRGRRHRPHPDGRLLRHRHRSAAR